MGQEYTETAEERIGYLDSVGRRCIGQNGHCMNAAVDEFDVVPAVNGEADLNAKQTLLKTCGRHRMVVFANSKLHVVGHRRHVLALRRNRHAA